MKIFVGKREGGHFLRTCLYWCNYSGGLYQHVALAIWMEVLPASRWVHFAKHIHTSGRFSSASSARAFIFVWNYFLSVTSFTVFFTDTDIFHQKMTQGISWNFNCYFFFFFLVKRQIALNHLEKLMEATPEHLSLSFPVNCFF